jgi:hypothetical protein
MLLKDVKKMAYAGSTTQTPTISSSYRVKFKREEFLRLIHSVKPKIVYNVKNMFFFSYDGFELYTFECGEEDFTQDIYDAIEFSNGQWAKK